MKEPNPWLLILVGAIMLAVVILYLIGPTTAPVGGCP